MRLSHGSQTVPRPWISIQEYSKREWKQSLRSRNRTVGLELSHKLVKHGNLTHVTQTELESISTTVAQTHLFLLADDEGMCLQLFASSKQLNQLKEHCIEPGTHFAMKDLGINAISIAMESGNTAVVKGEEHSLEFFSSWCSICTPIQSEENILGYLNLSFNSEENEIFAAPLLGKIVRNIEERLDWMNPIARKKRIKLNLQEFHLTNKEKEVAYLWLEGYSRSEIAQMLTISQETVRFHVKNIYEKVEVNNQVEFVKKVILSGINKNY
ncbi:LuxR C-terminal-related transcriptional regulator [Paenibacillus sp. FSL H7-0756]|uniref:LuxR C-terminal-related transcriptional regulator n=1 Tax=unclassified Paenibacillus TaxID=185978 RepID=UPI0030F54B5E